jgi:hypothetical protein
VRSHGTGDDIAALRVRRQHEQLMAGEEQAQVQHQDAHSAAQQEAPALLVPHRADEHAVVLRGRVDGETRFFVVHREAMEAFL